MLWSTLNIFLDISFSGDRELQGILCLLFKPFRIFSKSEGIFGIIALDQILAKLNKIVAKMDSLVEKSTTLTHKIQIENNIFGRNK